MTEKYSTKNYKPGYSPSRLQHNYKMTYGDAYNLAQDLNKVFNRLYTVEQEKKRLRKAMEVIHKAMQDDPIIPAIERLAYEALNGKKE